MLLNLRRRSRGIRVFESGLRLEGNFLLIAYKEMRGIEAKINKRRGEGDRRSEIPLTNFRGSSCATSRPRSRAWRSSSRVSMRRALSRPEGGARGVPAAQC